MLETLPRPRAPNSTRSHAVLGDRAVPGQAIRRLTPRRRCPVHGHVALQLGGIRLSPEQAAARYPVISTAAIGLTQRVCWKSADGDGLNNHTRRPFVRDHLGFDVRGEFRLGGPRSVWSMIGRYGPSRGSARRGGQRAVCRAVVLRPRLGPTSLLAMSVWVGFGPTWVVTTAARPVPKPASRTVLIRMELSGKQKTSTLHRATTRL